MFACLLCLALLLHQHPHLIMVTVFSKVFFLFRFCDIKSLVKRNSVFKSKLVKYRIIKLKKKIQFFWTNWQNSPWKKKKNPQSLATPKHISTHNATYECIFCKTLEAQQQLQYKNMCVKR